MSDSLKALLEAVAKGAVNPATAYDRLRHFPEEDIGVAKIDHHRVVRQGHAEVILGEPKSVAQVLAIAERLAAMHQTFLVTRATPTQLAALAVAFPGAKMNPVARTMWLPPPSPGPPLGEIAVVTAGTSDIPVAEEAAVVAEAFGATVTRVFDAGVAGLHRILSARPDLERAGVIIVVAGMEGALPSVVGGLVRQPVIAVPTSVGYGASFGGIAALLGMLNSCADGVTVVNIDNGFGAAAAAIRILSGQTPGVV